MKSLLIKSTSILLVILIALMVNSIIFTDPVFVPKANAVDLNGDQQCEIVECNSKAYRQFQNVYTVQWGELKTVFSIEWGQ